MDREIGFKFKSRVTYHEFEIVSKNSRNYNVKGKTSTYSMTKDALETGLEEKTFIEIVEEKKKIIKENRIKLKFTKRVD